MFKITYTPTGIKVTATETGSVVSVKHTADGFVRENTFGTEDTWFESKKEIANAGYLGRFLLNFTGKLGKKNTPVAEKIKIMADAIKLYAGSTTYRTLNNRLRQHFDTNEIMTNADFRAEFFYEGAWRTGGSPKAVKAAPAAKPATKPAVKAAKPAVKKATPAATPAAVKATKPATVKQVTSKPKAKKATPKKVVIVPGADAPLINVDQDALEAEAENLILQDAPEAILVEDDAALLDA